MIYDIVFIQASSSQPSELQITMDSFYHWRLIIDNQAVKKEHNNSQMGPWYRTYEKSHIKTKYSYSDNQEALAAYGHEH